MNKTPKLSLFSPAKLNLFLHITGKRDDGYHNLQTVFRLLNWGDTLEFYQTDASFELSAPINDTDSPVTLTSNVQLTDTLADNLIIKAAHALIAWLQKNGQSEFTNKGHRLKTLPRVHIRLHKTLPTGAGLGGGSSNAATTLLALNTLWGLSIATQTLIQIGANIGADVPIFLFGQDAIAEGIGERLTPIDLPKQTYLILNPNAHVSTQTLFAHPNLARDMPTYSHTQIRDQTERFVNQLISPYCNVFEPIVTSLVPEVKNALDYLRRLEPVTGTTARMTGTGSSVYLPIPMAQFSYVMSYIEHKQAPPCDWIISDSTS